MTAPTLRNPGAGEDPDATRHRGDAAADPSRLAPQEMPPLEPADEPAGHLPKAAYKVLDIVRLSLHNLTVHAARSLLTMLSILFGVWSVIAMLAINEGAGVASERALRELGSSNIIVESVKPPQASAKASESTRGASTYGLTHLDARRLRDNVPRVARSVVSRRTSKLARVGANLLSVTVIATEPNYAELGRIDMRAGRFVSYADYLRAEPHCVITSQLARELFAYEEPLGQTLRLGSGGEAFRVVGVLDRLPRALAGSQVNPDACMVIPLTTDRSRMGELNFTIQQGSHTLERVEVSQVILQMEDEQAVLAGADVVRNLLQREHEDMDYHIEVPLELLRQQAKQQRLWNIMFTVIALVSLLVGGIGIANIMLASVTERTREIGVRRALGAKRRDITSQFLVESVTLTTLGGLLGIGVGTLIPFVVQMMLDIPAVLTSFTLFLPFVVAVLVGLISGLWPALRAARLDPIVALRHE